jgi:hypothetical protein
LLNLLAELNGISFRVIHVESLSVARIFVWNSFEFSPEEVIAFCTDCVLADDEEPCEIPDAFYELDRLKP